MNLNEWSQIDWFVLEMELVRHDYSVYIEYVHHGQYIPSRHSDLICRKLEQVERGEVDRLMIFMPPRHSKSMTVSETFPSWFIGRNPERRVILTSYGETLARKFGRANKHKIAEFGKKIFGIELSQDNSSVTNWDIQGHRGGMISVGIGGALTGQGADLLIIDDPIKNKQEAESDTYRENIWNEWQNTLRTRLQPGGKVILIQTRWHEDDLAGRLLQFEPSRWEILSLPAVCENENDPLARAIGEPLWPEYGFDEKWVEETRQSVGSQTWAALFQQRPSPAEGAILKRKWWRYYRQLPSRFDEVIQSWDCTFKDKKDSDYVVGQVWGRIGADKYLIDQVRGQMDLPATMQAIRGLSAKHPYAYTKLIEDKANGPAVIQMLHHEIPGLIPVNPEGGKESRAAAASVDLEAGNVFIPEPSIAPWIHDFVEECAAFPNGKNDDQVDAFSQAMIRFRQFEAPEHVVLPSIKGWAMRR
ncbi:MULTISPECIES: phage terminase large subunit [unclassified Thermoactinomyces]|uniref:phage terminase large subunit n=1 Tax=unclassified Thermoactinomyces TaxID=2634588 RepID=UPI0018DB2FE5|nr:MULTISPECIES: phage terminase large subunit [unclassified Thermoactinomyces]MBH8599082.1 phage terminase large subunit [Thermoactinomyces sp. CICC 10523]MBH8607987.1 phage terminase large subunit [Thermoactinomyces sp. CICC 10521]